MLVSYEGIDILSGSVELRPSADYLLAWYPAGVHSNTFECALHRNTKP